MKRLVILLVLLGAMVSSLSAQGVPDGTWGPCQAEVAESHTSYIPQEDGCVKEVIEYVKLDDVDGDGIPNDRTNQCWTEVTTFCYDTSYYWESSCQSC